MFTKNVVTDVTQNKKKKMTSLVIVIAILLLLVLQSTAQLSQEQFDALTAVTQQLGAFKERKNEKRLTTPLTTIRQPFDSLFTSKLSNIQSKWCMSKRIHM
jgi:hypothetical protein